jgi:hypothetical protein
MITRKLGRLPRIYNPAVPHMSSIFKKIDDTPIPVSIDYTDGMPDDYGMMLNDQLGCCTCAAYYHAIQVWSYHTNKTDGRITEPDLDVLQLYKDSCGYNPSNPLSDQGGIEQNVLTFLLNTGAPTGFKAETRHKIRAFVEVDVRNINDVKRAIYQCGCVYIGFEVPESLMAGGEPPKVWNVKKNSKIEGGHAIILVGYDKNNFDLISWGKKYKMSTKFFNQYVDEAYALCDIDWFVSTGKTILGLSIKELEEQMKYLRKGV